MVSFYLFVFLAVALMVFYFIILADSLFGGCDFATNNKAVSQIARIIQKSQKSGGVLFDLGCSRGGFALKILQACPKLTVYGVDNDWIRIFLARIKSFLLNRPVKFIHKDIFSTDISKADVIYLYLDRSLLPKLQTKLQKELKSEAIVITNRIFFPDWKPSRIFPVEAENPKADKIFVYERF